MKYFAGFVATVYFLGALVFGVIHYRDHPEGSFFDAVAGGLAWLGLASWSRLRDPQASNPALAGYPCPRIDVGQCGR